MHPPQSGDFGGDAGDAMDASVVLPAAADAGTCVAMVQAADVTVTASDGMVLAATYSNPCSGAPRPTVVLSHQLCASKGEWSAPGSDWVAALGKRGIATLAIDLRGHGGSTKFPDGTTHDLCTESEQPAGAALVASVPKDVAAGIAWVRLQKQATSVGVVGSSVGGNSGLVAFGDDTTLRVAVALSPGTDYYGIAPGTVLAGAGARHVALLAADDDPDSATAVRVFAQSNAALDTKVWPAGGHGNAVIAAHPEELVRLADFVAAAF